MKYIPVISGYHFHGMTTGGGMGYYYGYRGSMALSSILRTRYSPVRPVFIGRRYAYWLYKLIIRDENASLYCRAVKDGKKLGSLLRATIGELSIYKAPYVKSGILELIGFMRSITFNDVKPPNPSEQR
ncbi:MAG: hypothetical protein QW247_07680 [Pyrobaculum sp.]